MRKFLYGLAVVLALTPLATIAQASAAVTHPMSAAAHAAARPFNYWDGNPQIFSNENWPSDCARIDSTGALIIGSGDCTYFEFSPDNLELMETDAAGDITNNCLYYDKLGARDGIPNSYDIDACSMVVPADEWYATSHSNTWSQWYTGQNDSSDDSMWADGVGTSHHLYATGMNGTNPDDHWNAAD